MFGVKMVEEIRGVTKPYDHSKETLREAMGLTIEQMEKQWHEIYDICVSSQKESQLAEGLEHKLSRRELAYYATKYIYSEYQQALDDSFESSRIIIFKMRGSSPDK